MFNKSKKYCIVKCLPFICFANIKAVYFGFKSGKDDIKVVVDDVVYSLNSGIEITEDYDKKILLKDIIVKGNKWKINNEGEYNQNLYDVIYKGDVDYKLVSFKMNNDEYVKEDASDKLKNKTYRYITSGLTLYFESVYILNKDSSLNDSPKDYGIIFPEAINIKDTEILFSDLKAVSSIEALEKFIKNKFENRQFYDKIGYLADKKISEIKFDEFFIDQCLDGDKLNEEKVKEIVKNIKENNNLYITFRPYFNYTINEIKLSDNLAKTRKTKNDLIQSFTKNNTNLLKKQIEKLDYYDISLKIEGIKGFENVVILTTTDVGPDDPALKAKFTAFKVPDEGDITLTIVADPDGKFSEPMKGTITFAIDGSVQYASIFKGNEIPVIFGEKIKEGDGYSIIDTDTTQKVFKEQIKKYLGNVESGPSTYEVTFDDKFGGNNSNGTATDGFDVKVTFKGVVNNFTKNLEAGNKNVNIEFVIKDNNENKYKLVDGLSNSTKAFKGDLNYSGFINALETELNKGGELADAISEVKYDNGTTNSEWTSTTPGTIDSLKIGKVIITLKQNENGKYVVKAVSTPPTVETTQFTLTVSTNVSGKKVKEEKKTLTVTLENSKLTAKELYAKVKEALNNDDKFIIKNGNNKVEKDTNNLENNPNAYSIELTEGSKFIEADKKDDEDNKDNKGNQNGDSPTETKIKEKQKGCCGGKCGGGKCSGGDKREK